jgi:hypothetical protein
MSVCTMNPWALLSFCIIIYLLIYKKKKINVEPHKINGFLKLINTLKCWRWTSRYEDYKHLQNKAHVKYIRLLMSNLIKI